MFYRLPCLLQPIFMSLCVFIDYICHILYYYVLDTPHICHTLANDLATISRAAYEYKVSSFSLLDLIKVSNNNIFHGIGRAGGVVVYQCALHQ